MDFRRSAFVEEWFFGEGNDTAGKVVWYVAPPGAKVYKGPTPYRSLDTVDKFDLAPGGVGPVQGKRFPWSDGATIPLYDGQGPPCGEQWFENGIPSPPPLNPNRNPDGVPECCVPFRFGAFSMSANARAGWNYRVPALGVRQVKTQSLTGNTFSIFWGPPTENLSVQVGIVSAALPSAGAFAVDSPAGWTTVQSATYDGKGWQLWLLATGLPSRLSDGPFTCPYAAIGIIALEIVGVVGSPAVDVHRCEGSTSIDSALGPAPLAYPYEIEIGAFTATSSFGGILPAYNVGISVVGVPSIPSLCLASWRITTTAEPLTVFAHADGPTHGKILGLLSIPSMAPPGHGFAAFGAYAAAAWQSTMSAFTQFAMTAGAPASWAGVGAFNAAFALDATADAAWAGVAASSSSAAWASVSIAAFISVAGFQGAAAMTATASASWAGAAIRSGAFAMTATASASWAGVTAARQPFDMTANALASWVSPSGPSISQHAKTTFSGTSGNLTWGSATAAGEVQFVAVATERGSGGAITITPPSGYTSVQNGRDAGSGSPRVGLYVRTAGTSQASTGNWTVSNSGGTAIIGWSVAGLVATGTVDKLPAFSSSSGSFSTIATNATGTTTHAVELVFAVLAYGATGGTLWTWGSISGWTQLDTQSDGGASVTVAVYWRLTAATGSFSATSSNGPSSSPAGSGAIIASYE